MVDVLYKVYVLTLRFKYYFDDAKLCKKNAFRSKRKPWLNMFQTNGSNRVEHKFLHQPITRSFVASKHPNYAQIFYVC